MWLNSAERIKVILCTTCSFELETGSSSKLVGNNEWNCCFYLLKTRNNFESTRQEVERLMQRMKSANQDYRPPSQWTMEGYLYVQEKRESRRRNLMSLMINICFVRFDLVSVFLQIGRLQFLTALSYLVWCPTTTIKLQEFFHISPSGSPSWHIIELRTYNLHWW